MRHLNLGVEFGKPPAIEEAPRPRSEQQTAALVAAALASTDEGDKDAAAVKEAAANLTQMCEGCHAIPDGFSVLSGDDLFTLPLMSVGGVGVISVASNEVPAAMAQLVEAARDGALDRARTIHDRLLPLMQVNFVESNPIPVKAAMAHLGLLDLHYRLPMLPPRPESLAKIVGILETLGLSR